MTDAPAKRGIERIEVYFAAAMAAEEPPAAAFAFVVFSEDEAIHSWAAMVDDPNPTVARAHYAAVISALDWLLAAKKRSHHVRFYGDSLVVINQLNRQWTELREETEKMNDAAMVRALKFKDIAFTWITKEKSSVIRGLAEQELKGNGLQPRRSAPAARK
jgi:ribonuclease HI